MVKQQLVCGLALLKYHLIRGDNQHSITYFSCLERWSTPNYYWSAKVTAVTRIINPNFNLYAFGTQLWHEASWAIRAGSNAFWVAYHFGEDDTSLAGDELTQLKYLFGQSSECDENPPSTGYIGPASEASRANSRLAGL